MTYIENINIINQVKDTIVSDISSEDRVDVFGQKYLFISCFYLNRSDSQGAYVCSKVGETDPDCFCENIHYTMGTMK